jgi:hypothetical protein
MDTFSTAGDLFVVTADGGGNKAGAGDGCKVTFGLF